MTTRVSFLILASLVVFGSACKKAGTLTVNIKRQSVGQPIVITDSVAVLVKSTTNSTKFFEGVTSGQGIVIFDKVENDIYDVSSEFWDGSKELADIETVEVKNGKSVSVDLLLR